VSFNNKIEVQNRLPLHSVSNSSGRVKKKNHWEDTGSDPPIDGMYPLQSYVDYSNKNEQFPEDLAKSAPQGISLAERGGRFLRDTEPVSLVFMWRGGVGGGGGDVFSPWGTSRGNKGKVSV